MLGQGQEGLRSDGFMPDSFAEAVSRTSINGVITSTKPQKTTPL